MLSRSRLAFVIVAATACTSVENPAAIAPADLASAQFETAASGVKPPPPLGTQETEMRLDVFSSETAFARTSGPSAGASALDFSFHARVAGRYMANTQGTNGWVDFVTYGEVVASPNARLQYNEKTGKTYGVGTLTDNGGNVLYLNLIQITWGSFGSCGAVDQDQSNCAQVAFTYGNGGSGRFSVNPAVFNEE